MAKHEIIILKLSQTYKKLKAKVIKGEMHLPKKIQETRPKISPLNVFEEEKAFYKIWRNPKRIIIHVEGNMRPISLEKKDDGATPRLGFLNLDDIVDAVKKAIIKSLAKFRPMKLEWFIILLAIGVINVMATLYMLLRVLPLLGG